MKLGSVIFVPFNHDMAYCEGVLDVLVNYRLISIVRWTIITLYGSAALLSAHIAHSNGLLLDVLSRTLFVNSRRIE